MHSVIIDELRKIYNRAFGSVPEAEGLLAQQNAGVRAVVRGLRPHFEKAFREGGFYLTSRFPVMGEKEYADKVINEILGDAGEQVAGVLTGNDGTVEAKSLKQEAVAAPAADPSSAVCVWTRGGPMGWLSGCGHYMPTRSCFYCPTHGKPIKFTEAK